MMQQNIKPEDLMKEIKELTPGQCILIDFPGDVAKRLELLDLQIVSAEKLFTAYINNTSELANEFNLQKFMSFYANMASERDSLFLDTMITLIGTEAYSYWRNEENKTCCVHDRNIGKLIIRKRPEAAPQGAAV